MDRRGRLTDMPLPSERSGWPRRGKRGATDLHKVSQHGPGAWPLPLNLTHAILHVEERFQVALRKACIRHLDWMLQYVPSNPISVHSLDNLSYFWKTQLFAENCSTS